MAAYKKGHWASAAERFAEARVAFAKEGDDLKSAEMANNLCVVMLQQKRSSDALEAVEGTWDIFLAHGEEHRAAQAYGNLAAAREACGDLAGAEEAYQLAADMLDKLGDGEARSQTLAALSRLQLKRGQPLQAVTSMQSSLEDSSRPSFGRRLLRKILRLPSRFLRP